MKIKTTLAALMLCGASTAALADDYPHTARDLAATCANCHGTDGRSVGGMTTLAGVPADTSFEQLMEFRSGERPATIMHQIAKGYTEEQLRMVAEYFAAQN